MDEEFGWESAGLGQEMSLHRSPATLDATTFILVQRLATTRAALGLPGGGVATLPAASVAVACRFSEP